MTPERFRTIVAAYGADARRWPAGERVAAAAFAREDADARLLIDIESRLDDALFAHHVALPSAALRDRVLAAAPVGSIWSRARLWWSGIALAAAASAGVLAGSAAVAFVPAPDHLSSYATTDLEDDAS